MTKIKSFSALKTVIDINRINLDTIEWVERATAKELINQIKETINQIREVETDETDE
jgi:hypothetical protein